MSNNVDKLFNERLRTVLHRLNLKIDLTLTLTVTPGDLLLGYMWGYDYSNENLVTCIIVPGYDKLMHITLTNNVDVKNVSLLLVVTVEDHIISLFADNMIFSMGKFKFEDDRLRYIIKKA